MPPKYKPGGKKFPPRVSSKQLPKQLKDSNSIVSETPNSSGLNDEAENQFELELCWCIQQLQINLQSGKLVEKQLQDGTKTLNVLKSNTVPLIRKRQVMRNTFGDYRAKMIEDEKKHGKYVSNIRFSPLKQNSGKSLFVRKAGTNLEEENLSIKESDNEENILKETTDKKTFVMSKDPSDVQFKFNFSAPESK